MQQTNRSRHRHITSFQVISLGFLSVILLGSLLLMLPIATKSGQCTSFLDALFTATSAVCVTGLVVNDTATYWSLFGQGVILLLIQIGGMGIITIAIAIAVASGRKIGLMQRSTMQEAISAPTVGGIVRRTQFIIRTTILIEIIGAVLLAPVFCRDFGFWKGIWYSLFHSISAFCNAGFDLIGIRTPFSSLTSYSVQPIVNLVIMMLIIAGGIGFLIWAVVDFFRGNTITGWASMMVSLWFIGGLLLLSVGIVGEYVGKIYLESKHRPRYIIESCTPDRIREREKGRSRKQEMPGENLRRSRAEARELQTSKRREAVQKPEQE